MSIPLVFIDTETTGLHSDLRRIWEVGMIRREPDGSENELQFFIEADLAMADPFALKIGGFYERSPQGKWLTDRRAEARRPSYWYPDLAAARARDDSVLAQTSIGGCSPVSPESYWPHGEMVSRYDAAGIIAKWTHGAHLVGAVPSFDAESLTALLREARQLAPGWHYHLIDAENLAVGYLRGRGTPVVQTFDTLFESSVPGTSAAFDAALQPPWDSDELGRLLGVEITDEDRHTALGDARWAKRMYDAVMH